MYWFLLMYFTISFSYAVYVYNKTFKTFDHFIMNLLFGPINMIYLIYKYLLNIENRLD